MAPAWGRGCGRGAATAVWARFWQWCDLHAALLIWLAAAGLLAALLLWLRPWNLTGLGPIVEHLHRVNRTPPPGGRRA